MFNYINLILGKPKEIKLKMRESHFNSDFMTNSDTFFESFKYIDLNMMCIVY